MKRLKYLCKKVFTWNYKDAYTRAKILKKKYGENFSKLCRELFPSILENEGELVSIITSLFKESHFLYDDLITYDRVRSFQRLVMNKYNKNTEGR